MNFITIDVWVYISMRTDRQAGRTALIANVYDLFLRVRGTLAGLQSRQPVTRLGDLFLSIKHI